MDVIEFGAGAKFVYAFRLTSVEYNEPLAKKMRLPLLDRNHPSIKDCPEAFHKWVVSKRNLERTLVEESDELDQKLEEQNSLKHQLDLEQQKLAEYSQSVTKQLESQFSEQKKLLEEKVIRGDMEKNQLQKEKEALEQRMLNNLKELEVKSI